MKNQLPIPKYYQNVDILTLVLTRKIVRTTLLLFLLYHPIIRLMLIITQKNGISKNTDATILNIVRILNFNQMISKCVNYQFCGVTYI